MRAILPMYDLPEVRAATDAWWAGVARRLRDAGIDAVPDALERGVDRERTWRAPDLLLAQTCGYPLTHALRGVVRLVATPAYDAPGARAASYSSAIVVRSASPARGLAELRGAAFAANALDSQSGWHALRAAVAPLAGAGGFFGDVRITGQHALSIEAVAAGEADAAAIDCVTLALLARHRPRVLAEVRILGWTPSTPGLPYVTRAAASDADVGHLRAALRAAAGDPGLASARADLLITGIEVLPDGDYEVIPVMEREAARLAPAL